MSAELKPCPFCASTPKHDSRIGHVWCGNDHCTIVGQIFTGGVRHWNRRAPVASAPALTNEDILLLVCDHTGKRISLRVDECHAHIDFARAIIARITGEGE